MTASRPRISKVRFRGLRTAADVELTLEPMNVLIGRNGVGKSTIIEGLELLRLVMSGGDFLRTLNDEHGGARALVRHGESMLRLGIDVVDGDATLTYDITLSVDSGGLSIDHETAEQDGVPLSILLGARPTGTIDARRAFLPILATSNGMRTLGSMLDGIEIHVPFASQPRWYGSGTERAMRSDNVVQATTALARGGSNLANAYHTLRNRSDWEDTRETLRLLVDDDLKDVITPASASGGTVGLAVVYRGGRTVPAFALSDGTLGLLALIAIARLEGGDMPRSLLVLDEPDLHLQPDVLPYVVELLEACSQRQPVVIATHSDRLLDSLSEPARSTVLCDLDADRRLRLRRPDPSQLKPWLEEYRGIGRVRDEGYSSFVFPSPSSAADKP